MQSKIGPQAIHTPRAAAGIFGLSSYLKAAFAGVLPAFPDTKRSTRMDSAQSSIREAPSHFGGLLRNIGPGVVVSGSVVGSGELW